MSEGFAAPPPPAPAPRARPATVTIADTLLLVVAVVYVISFIMAISTIGTVTEILEEEFAGTEAEGAEGVAAAIGVGFATINLLIAIGLVVLAVLNNRGKNPARIVTWVLGGIGLCCAGVGLLGSSVGASFGGAGDSGVDQERLEQRMTDALPGWYEPVNIAIMVISILALAAALILLALPPSNEFFRKQPPPFEPPPPAYPPVG